MKKIRIRSNDVQMEAELAETPSAEKIWDALPITGRANTWGDEIYFSIPVSCPQEPEASDQMPVGSIAYWPPGSAFCILFGATPASHGNEPRFASPCNPLGKVIGDATTFRRVRSGDEVILEQA